jgi:hypothetical protein
MVAAEIETRHQTFRAKRRKSGTERLWHGLPDVLRLSVNLR